MKGWLQPTRAKRILFFIAFDFVAVMAALFLAFWLRFDGSIPSSYLNQLLLLLGLFALLKLPIFYFQRFYRMSWSYVGLSELITVFKGVIYGSFLLGTVSFLFRETALFLTFPRSILFIDFGITLMLVGGVRLLKRVYLQLRQKPIAGSPTLIVGAGDAGEQLLRSILKERRPEHLPVGFVDDSPAKQGLMIHGFSVLGPCKALPQLVKRHAIQTILIATPSATSSAIRNMVDRSRKAGVTDIKVLPPLSELFSGRISATQLRQVNLEDLLGRSPVTVDTRVVERFLKGKTVLVTGAAGSIGSELCRQIARFSPAKLFLLDQDETGIFSLERQLNVHFPDLTFAGLMADVRDREKVFAVIARHRPQVLFHAAAYKHVGLMERFPEEAVKNNVLGTKVVAEAAIECGVKKFVLISTDKAVNPTSVMGASKRLCEILILALNQRQVTQFSAVRFGNVLGSRGSVVPIFEEQIKKRGPVTITHPDMRRYFMITSEAVLLVLQAAAMGQGGEVFVLDMGKPVKILDLARELIQLHGFEPDKDIPIVFTQPVPGEKLTESLLTSEEGTKATQHQRIFQAHLNAQIPERQLWEAIETFESGRIVSSRDVLAWLKTLVPEYNTPD